MIQVMRGKFKCHHFQVFTIINLILRYEKRYILILTVINCFLLGAHGQSYHFAVGRHQRNFQQFSSGVVHSVPNETNVNLTKSSSDLDTNITNTSLQGSNRQSSDELSKAAMDVITVAWYVATFLALAAFFMLMACSDRRCSSNAARSASESINQPPTPAPSYTEFAPPSYDSVIGTLQPEKTSVFIISYQVDQSTRNDDTINRIDVPTIDVSNINELSKVSC